MYLRTAGCSDARNSDQAKSASGGDPSRDHERTCLARTSLGGRCKNARVDGQLCKRHSNLFNSEKHRHARRERVRNAFAQAHAAWTLANQVAAQEDADLSSALRLSVEENQNARREREEAQARLYPRLAHAGLQPVPTAARGGCQFIAIVQTANLPTHHAVFRGEVVDYLARTWEAFSAFADMEDFDAYLAKNAVVR